MRMSNVQYCTGVATKPDREFRENDVEMLRGLKSLFRPAEMRRDDKGRVEVEDVRDQQEKEPDIKEGREEAL